MRRCQNLYLCFFSLISPLFPSQCPCDKILLHMSMDSTLQCEAIWSVQEIFVCAIYVLFHQLPSVGLSGFFRKFSCAQHSTVFPTTKCRTFWFFQEIFVHTTYTPCSTDNTGAHSGLPRLLLNQQPCCHSYMYVCMHKYVHVAYYSTPCVHQYHFRLRL